MEKSPPTLVGGDATLTLDKGRVPVQWRGGDGLPEAGTLLVLCSIIKKRRREAVPLKAARGGMHRDEPTLHKNTHQVAGNESFKTLLYMKAPAN